MFRSHLFLLLIAISSLAAAQSYSGLDSNIGNIYRLSDAQSFSISPENFTGEKGKGGMATEGTGAKAAAELGRGWKISPSVIIDPGKTFTVADISGEGAIEHIWMTPTGDWRLSILRIYWDGEKDPSVEVPVADFFAQGLGKYARVASVPIGVNPGSGFNSYWPMPFRRHATITFQNMDDKPMYLYYQVDFTRAHVPEDAAYFHAQFRRVYPLAYKQVYTILDGIQGKGQYVGTYMVWGSHSSGWWGEGEIKFYIDGDRDFPTINGTGVEDYFNGSYGFVNPDTQKYEEFTNLYAGMPQATKPDGLNQSQQRFSLYRWHIPDPIRFTKDLRVTIQALGWRSNMLYLPLQDDISSVAFWYQAEPHAPFPKLPAREQLEVN